MTRLLILALAVLAGYALGRAVKREEVRKIKSAHKPNEPKTQRYDVDGKKLTRAEILQLPMQKRREILKQQADMAAQETFESESE